MLHFVHKPIIKGTSGHLRHCSNSHLHSPISELVLLLIKI